MGMNENESRIQDAAAPRPCALPWCTTAHGATQHPDDETHRSDGLALALRVRAGEDARPIDLEIGLIRRLDDDEMWLALETSDGEAIEIALADARAVLRQALRDEALGPALAPALDGRA